MTASGQAVALLKDRDLVLPPFGLPTATVATCQLLTRDNRSSPFFKMAQVWISDVFCPQHLTSRVIGAGGKKRLDSRIKEFKPHVMFDCF